MASHTCLLCGRELMDPDSVERGIGPECLKTVEEARKIQPDPDIAEKKSTLPPSSIIVKDRFRKQLGDLSELCTSIAKLGLIHAIVVTKNNRLVSGERRLAAWKLLYPSQPIPVKIIPEYITDAEIEENTVRQDFTASELAAIYRHYKPQIATEAKQRQEATQLVGKGVQKQDINGGGNFPRPKGKTRNILGKIAGVSGKTLEKAATIVEAAEEKPKEYGKILEDVDNGKRSIHSAYGTIRNRQKQLTAPPPPPVPEGKYRAIIIDPPWPMRKITRELRPNQGETLEYPTMTLEEIQDLPIPDLAYMDGCHIYLWTTQKYLPAALECYQLWGVNYQCLMTWLKPGGFTPYSWQYNTEHVLFGRIGNLPLERLGLKLGFTAPRREHSRKPDHFYKLVTEASPEPRLELFARQQRQGFTTWGNQTNHYTEALHD